MNDKPSRRERILEAIELSDRGREDASDPAMAELAAPIADRPELAELRQRSKWLDDVLRRAVRDVPVPEGLERRILVRLRPSPAEPRDQAIRRPRARSRRWWIAVAAGSVAGAVLVAGLLGFWTSEPYTLAQVLNEGVGQFIPGQTPPGQRLSNEVLASHPLATEVRRMPGVQWRKVDAFLGREAVAYEMSAGGGIRATLFVVPYRHSIAGLRTSPPSRPQQATGGKAAAAWQTNGMLYVLVVAGNERSYRMFLDLGRPLA